MATNIGMTEAFELVLSAPGMDKVTKISLNISAANLLLLNCIIEKGLGEQETTGILANFPQESKKELQIIADELLEKGELKKMKERLEKFQK